ncbi:hypothetical protein DAPPUDRAFT_234512 [Daphnia pulex]|uniref:Uncharacterized protein n=1 Tax=Daphnia pulex TaxID=6669 RepID=E9FWS8_DAPPU|nr:hypothetical protein DAPPUDRAFT_234512 [Daphnia pulex]|eukprot:EFX87947.1 hypothetical protein DAPPUDRAFT_234512 [Daphnia pulex]
MTVSFMATRLTTYGRNLPTIQYNNQSNAPYSTLAVVVVACDSQMTKDLLVLLGDPSRAAFAARIPTPSSKCQNHRLLLENQNCLWMYFTNTWRMRTKKQTNPSLARRRLAGWLAEYPLSGERLPPPTSNKTKKRNKAPSKTPTQYERFGNKFFDST